MNTQTVTNLPEIDNWLRVLALRCRSTTIYDYRLVLLQFGKWLDGRPITDELLIGYRDWMQTRREPPLAASRIRLAFSAIRSYLGHRREHGETDLPSAVGLKMPKRKKGGRTGPNAGDVQRWFDAASRVPRTTCYERLLAARDLAILACLANNGLRRRELLGLRASDILVERQAPGSGAERPIHLRVRCAKGGDPVVMPIFGETRILVLEYVRARADYLTTAGRTQTGLWLVGAERVLSHSGLDALCTRLASSAGTRRYTPHQLRHYHGTAVQQVADTATAMLSLRHSRMTTTEDYLHSDSPRLEAALQAIASKAWRESPGLNLQPLVLPQSAPAKRSASAPDQDGRGDPVERPVPRRRLPGRVALPADCRPPRDSIHRGTVRAAAIAGLIGSTLRRQPVAVGS